MSEREFRSWEETWYLLKSDKNRQALDKSIDQLKNGKVKTRSVEEWQNLANEKA